MPYMLFTAYMAFLLEWNHLNDQLTVSIGANYEFEIAKLWSFLVLGWLG